MVTKIVILEDENFSRSFIVAALSRAGYETVATPSCEEAVRLFSRPDASIRLLIADLILPSGNGTELALELAGKNPALKYLFVSGTPIEAWKASDIKNVRLLPKGSAAFLGKPFPVATLLEKVKLLLNDSASAQTA